MIPAGYMLKHVVAPPEWLKAPQVTRVCSVSACVSKDFADHIETWRHNGLWLFDSAELVAEIARDKGVDLAGLRLFYYESYEFESDLGDQDGAWKPLDLKGGPPLAVSPPATKRLLGYDVVTYFDMLECSPLSCNSMAAELPTNADCLFDTFDEAKAAVDQGRFDNCEPGDYRIFAVYEAGEIRGQLTQFPPPPSPSPNR